MAGRGTWLSDGYDLEDEAEGRKGIVRKMHKSAVEVVN